MVKNESSAYWKTNIKVPAIDQRSKIIRSLGTKMATRPDKILVKVVKTIVQEIQILTLLKIAPVRITLSSGLNAGKYRIEKEEKI